MGIFSRISDIINANINSLLDSAENPEKMIRLVIQEMEETLVEVRTNSARVLAEKKELLRRNERLQAQADDWERKAELALNKNREDLAKAALVEKSTVKDVIEVVQEDLNKLDETLERLTHEIEQLQTKLNDAKARQKVMLMRTRATQSRVSVNQRLNDRNLDNALDKLDYFEQKIEQMEGQIEADQLGNTGLHDEFEELEVQEKIDAELKAMKDRLHGDQPAAEKAPAAKKSAKKSTDKD